MPLGIPVGAEGDYRTQVRLLIDPHCDFDAAKKREMILQLHEPSLVGNKMLFDTRELSAASWVSLVIIDLFGFGFGFGFCDRGKHNLLNRRNPAFNTFASEALP
jgi:hypothetical protein